LPARETHWEDRAYLFIMNEFGRQSSRLGEPEREAGP